MKIFNLRISLKKLPTSALATLLVLAPLQVSRAQKEEAKESVAAASCVEAPAGLIGWWRGEESAVDAVSKEAALQDSVSYGAGKVGRDFDFSTTETVVRLPASEKRNEETRNGFTFEFWMNPLDIESGHPLIEFRNDQKVGLHIWIYDAVGRLWVNLRDTEGEDHSIKSAAGLLRRNVWQHIAITYDSKGIATIYCNGAMAARNDVGVFSPQMAYELYLGAHHPGGSEFYRGALDEVSLYNRALSSDEIASIYLAGSAGKCLPEQKPVSSTTKAKPAAPIKDLSLMAEPFVEFPAEFAPQDRISAEVEKLFKDKQYEKLEQLAAEYRSSKAAWSYGEWKLSTLYDQISSAKASTDASWQDRIAQIKEWVAQKPDSVVARVALAFAYHEGAYRARGGGFADTVTEQGAAQMEEREKLAQKNLGAVYAKRKSYPEWYKAISQVAIMGDVSPKRYFELVEEGTRLFPAFHELPKSHVYYLLPRWHGVPGQWENFVARTADRIGGKEGDILYAQVIWQFNRSDDILEESNPSWPREKRGWQALSTLYPDDLRIASLWARRSYKNGDMAKARTLFQKTIKNRLVWGIWKSEQEFLLVRSVVLATPEKSKALAAKF